MSTDGRLVDSTQKPPSHADKLMKRALEIARERLGSVSPRPAVGVVVARGDCIVAAASTEPGSGRHAERAAIEMAGDKTRGADLYVTLNLVLITVRRHHARPRSRMLKFPGSLQQWKIQTQSQVMDLGNFPPLE